RYLAHATGATARLGGDRLQRADRLRPDDVRSRLTGLDRPVVALDGEHLRLLARRGEHVDAHGVTRVRVDDRRRRIAVLVEEISVGYVGRRGALLDRCRA